MKTQAVTVDGELVDPGAPEDAVEVHRFMDFFIGPGWVIHQLDDELCVVSLLKLDAPKARNLHAEVLIAAIGVPEARTPKLYGDVVFLTLKPGLISRKPKFRGLSQFHDELIIETFAAMEEAGV